MEANISTNRNRRKRAPLFELIAGAVCLDFVNTLDDRFSDAPKELLKEYADLARFAEDSGILSDPQVDRLVERSLEHTDAARRELVKAIRLRGLISEVFYAIAWKKPVPHEELMALNGFVQEAAQHLQIVESGGRFEWKFDDADDLDAPLWPIARSAAELLASDRVEFVRACASKTCEWLFLDESKNHRRRWCDMTKCGNRAKVRSFYSRKRKEL